jgi:hypothetical protein
MSELDIAIVIMIYFNSTKYVQSFGVIGKNLSSWNFSGPVSPYKLQIAPSGLLLK